MLYFLRKAFSFNKAIKRPLAAYRIIPNLLKLEDRVVPVTGAFTSVPASLYAPLGVAEVTFAQIVTGVDNSDFELLKDGNPIDLTTAVFSGSTSGGSIYHLSNLELLTNAVGSYTLRLKASGTGIADQASSPLTGQPSVTWVRASSSISTTADSTSTTANTSTTLTPLANDSNADGSSLRVYSSTSINPSQASLVRNTDGTFTFQSVNNGSFSFNYTVTGQQTKVVASDAAADDYFGKAVAFSGDTIVVGAYLGDVGAVTDQGSAYVFTRSGSGWTFQQKLSASDGAASDNFGASVAISGDTIVIGASRDDIGSMTDQGSAYVFTRSAGVWTQQAKLTANNGTMYNIFGSAVAISGDTIAIASPGDYGYVASHDSIYIFTREGIVWTLQQQLVVVGTTNPIGNAPTALSLSGSILAVGLYGYPYGLTPYGGAVAIFTLSGSIWSEQTKIFNADMATHTHFGVSVSLSGNTLAVGASTKDEPGQTDQGATYVFTTNGSTWTQQAKLLASDGASYDYFGYSVSLLGDTLLVGAGGDDGSFSDQGSVYVFKRSGSTWSQYAKFSDTSGAASDAFGKSVVLAGDTLVSGAPGAALNQGSIVFQNINLATNTASIIVGTPVTGAFTSVSGSLYTPLGVADITFSQIVTGVDKSDFELLKDGNPIDLTTAVLSGTISGGTIYRLSNLELLTNAVGSYTLQLKASGTGIVDQAATALTGQPSVTWVRASSSISTTADSTSTTANTSTTLTPLANDSNADGSGLRVYSATPINPSQASLVQNADGTFTFQSIANGSFSFNYTATGQQTKIVASDAAANDNFGNAIAFSGDTIVVGAYLDDFGAVTDQGSAYVFTRSGSGWTFQQKLSASDGLANDYFGASVAISGDTIVIGASQDDIGANANQGSAYVFTRSNGVWTQQAKLTANNGTASNGFGSLVAISGDTIAISSPGVNSVYIFTLGNNIWSQVQQLVISGSAAVYGNDPTCLSLAGNILAVGLSSYYKGAVYNAGALAIFTLTGSTWSEQTKIFNSDTASSTNFGNSVSLSGSTITVGASLRDEPNQTDQGAVYIFTTNGSTWTQQAKLLASDGLAGDKFGTSVSLLGDTLLIGAPGDDGTYSDQGSVYVFKRSGSTWSQYAKFSDTSGAASDAFGSSVVLTGDSFVSSSYLDDATASNQGSFVSQNINLATNTASIIVGTPTPVTGAFTSVPASLYAPLGVADITFSQIVTGVDKSDFELLKDGNPIDLTTSILSGYTSGGSIYHLSNLELLTNAVGSYTLQLKASGTGIADQASSALTGQPSVTWVRASSSISTIADSTTTTTNTSTTLTPLANDSNADGSGLRVYSATPINPSQASLVQNADGTFTFQSIANGSFSFNYTATGQQTKVVASDAAADDNFGNAVAFSGDTIVVGAYLDDFGAVTDQGSAYVFTRSGSGWTFQQKLSASDGLANDIFGASVAISGDTIVIGASNDDIGANTNQGSAYVFTRSAGVWTQQAKLTAYNGTASNAFGSIVAIYNDTIAISSPGVNSVYIFTLGNNIWSQVQQLVISGSAAVYGNDPTCLSLAGNILAVGLSSYYKGANGYGAGAVAVFVSNGGIWSEQTKLFPYASGASFGAAVSISDNTLAVGATAVGSNKGTTVIFTTDGSTWSQQANLFADDGLANDRFGASVSLLGDTLLIGAPGDDGTYSDQGSVYVFKRSGSTWSQYAKFSDTSGATSDAFGSSVVLAGDTFISGAPSDDATASNQGSFVSQNINLATNSASITVGTPVPVTGAFTSVPASLYAPLGVADITFSQIVTGVDKSDFELLKDGNPIDLTTAILSGSNSGGFFFRLFNLELLTNTSGSYVLRLKLNGTGITNQSATPLTGQPSLTWYKSDSIITSTDQYTTTANTSTTLTPLANDSNADGSGLRVYSATPINPPQASLVQNADGTFTFQSVANGSFSFNYTATGQQTKVVASDAAADDNFGVSIAYSGDTIVVGARTDDVGAVSDQGSAYVFTRSGSGWTFQQKITATDGASGDNFGATVAIYGDTLVVGAPYDDNDYNNYAEWGSAYVFTRFNGIWTQEAKLKAADGNTGQYFGSTVSIYGDTIAINAPTINSTYIFTRQLNNWTQQQKIYQSNGQSVSLSLTGDILAVGTSDYSGDYSGFVNIWQRTSNTWSLVISLSITDSIGSGRFGASISIYGNTLAVGASLWNEGSQANQGATYIFTTDGSTWTQQAKLLASDGLAGDKFGTSVSLLGDTLLIGAPGDDESYADQGSIYVFKRSGSTWSQYAKFSDTSGAASDAFGSSVVLAGDTFISGAPSDDGTASNQGSFISQNINLATNTASITVGPVTVPVPLVLGITQDTGLQPNDGITNNQNLEFFGTSVNGYQIGLKINGISIGTTTTDSLGNWTFNYTANTLASGIYTVTAIATDLLGNVSVTSLGFSVEVDAGSPTGTIGPVTTPRNSNVSSVSLVFNENVFGVDLADFILSLNGTPLSLLGATINGSGSNYSIGNISSLTNGTGTYVLTLNASGSGITDAAGNSLMANASTTWVLDNVAPTASITGVTTPTNTAVTNININFSESVSNFNLPDMTLTRNGTSVSLASATISGSGSSYQLNGITSANQVDGTYVLTLNASGSGITDAVGNALTANTSTTWVLDNIAPTAIITGVTTPTNTAVASININFSETVANFNLPDLTLTRNGTAVSLASATISGSGSSYQLNGITSANQIDGTYVLTLNASGSGITDTVGNTLTANASTTWVLSVPLPPPPPPPPSGDTTPPTYVMGAVPSVGRAGLPQIAITFSESVTGFDISDIILTRSGAAVNIQGAVLTGSGSNYILQNLANLTYPIGEYHLQIKTSGTGITDLAGNALSSSNSADWRMVGPDNGLISLRSPKMDGSMEIREANSNDSWGIFTPFPNYNGAVHLLKGNFMGDGKEWMVMAAGEGGAPHIVIMDPVTGKVLRSWFGYGTDFRGGLFIAVGDVNGDGADDLITGPNAGGGPHIKVYDGKTNNIIFEFMAYAPSFLGGVSVALADVNRDGRLDIVTGTGKGGGPHVRVFDALNGRDLLSFMAYDPSFRGGVFVAAGDIDGNGTAEIVTGSGYGGTSIVRVFDLRTLQAVRSFMAYDPAFLGGVRVGLSDRNQDGILDIFTGPGPGGGPHIKVFDGVNLNLIDSYFAGSTNDPYGVYIN